MLGKHSATWAMPQPMVLFFYENQKIIDIINSETRR
jgi:hypothetical protein